MKSSNTFNIELVYKVFWGWFITMIMYGANVHCTPKIIIFIMALIINAGICLLYHLLYRRVNSTFLWFCICHCNSLKFLKYSNYVFTAWIIIRFWFLSNIYRATQTLLSVPFPNQWKFSGVHTQNIVWIANYCYKILLSVCTNRV